MERRISADTKDRKVNNEYSSDWRSRLLWVIVVFGWQKLKNLGSRYSEQQVVYWFSYGRYLNVDIIAHITDCHNICA